MRNSSSEQELLKTLKEFSYINICNKPEFVESFAMANLVKGLVANYDTNLQFMIISLLKHHMNNKANIEECCKLLEKDKKLQNFLFTESEKLDSGSKRKNSKTDEIYSFLLSLNDSINNNVKDSIEQDINKLLADTKFKKDALNSEHILKERRLKIKHKYDIFFKENKDKVI